MLNSRILKLIFISILNCFIFLFILNTNIVVQFREIDSTRPIFCSKDIILQHKISLISVYKEDSQRRIRRIYEPEYFLPQVKEIFDGVVSKKRKVLEGVEVHLPFSRAIVLARLLALSYSRGKEEVAKRLIENYIEYSIDNHLQLLPTFSEMDRAYRIHYREVIKDAYDLIAKFYEEHKEIFSSVKFPSFQEWESMIYFKKDPYNLLYEGRAFKYFNKIIIFIIEEEGEDPPPDRLLKALVHEGLHIIFPGFLNKLIDEGSTEFLTDEITSSIKIKDFRRDFYFREINITKEIFEEVGESIFLRAYAEGKLDLLKNVGEKVIELWQLRELLYVIYGKRDKEVEERIVNAVISQYPGVFKWETIDPLSAYIWKTRNSPTVLKFIEDQIYHYIVEGLNN